MSQMSLDEAVTETNAICELVYGDPMNAPARAAIIDAIRTVALRDGDVDPNRARLLYPSWVPPRLVSAVWNALKARDLLEPVRWTTNEDVKGRNVGKPTRVYEWRGDVA